VIVVVGSLLCNVYGKDEVRGDTWHYVYAPGVLYSLALSLSASRIKNTGAYT
jgi:hypothetical protein